jgi:hypothetical protein
MGLILRTRCAGVVTRDRCVFSLQWFCPVARMMKCGCVLTLSQHAGCCLPLFQHLWGRGAGAVSFMQHCKKKKSACIVAISSLYSSCTVSYGRRPEPAAPPMCRTLSRLPALCILSDDVQMCETRMQQHVSCDSCVEVLDGTKLRGQYQDTHSAVTVPCGLQANGATMCMSATRSLVADASLLPCPDLKLSGLTPCLIYLVPFYCYIPTAS